ncbi:MAG: hypothetical protein GF315_07050 [candidate division Zixibacteria bacterium]|nr:hypothetical protein [candidate division Zixibacteria bacterium]
MNTTLDYLRGNRKFLIKDFVVHGDYSSAEGGLLYAENLPTGKRIIFAHTYIVHNHQQVIFGNLYDHKENQLPTQLNSPKVIILPKNDVHCFLVGTETPIGFNIAKNEPSKTGLVDLLIIEME